MKSYTDLEQSKKLAEILPVESADMSYQAYREEGGIPDYQATLCPHRFASWIGIPCWSLAALLNILDYPQLSKDKLGGSGKEGWMISAYPNNCRYDSCWHDNPVDCCVEMICKLDENVVVKPWEWDEERGCSYPSCQISKK